MSEDDEYRRDDVEIDPGPARSAYDPSMVVAARDVAAELRRRIPELGLVQLHKLLYYCQSHHLAFLDQSLFDETVSAWDHGPVVGSLWKEEDEKSGPAPKPISSNAAMGTIGYVVSRYGQLSARELELLSHGEDPWIRANEHREPGGTVRIEPEWMRDYVRTQEAEPWWQTAARGRRQSEAGPPPSGEVEASTPESMRASLRLTG